MARINEDDIRRVRDATDLVSLIAEKVVLKQKGRLFWGCCPFHNEKTPSFKIDPSTQLWHCFGCGEGGDAFGFLMKSESMDFPDAVRYLAERANIELTETSAKGMPKGRRERLIAICEETAKYYHLVLMRSTDAAASAAREYFSGRGFGSDVSKHWELGYAPGRAALCTHLTSKGFTRDEIVDANVGLLGDKGTLRDRFYNRVMFPIHDLQGRTIAFGGRVVGSGEPKYLNTQETPIFHKSANLFAVDIAKKAIVETGKAVVVEGYTDAISLHEAGIRNVVATLGTALTLQHIKLLSRFAKNIVYLFDGDDAGLRAADRASEFIDWTLTPEAGISRVELFVAVLPGGKDPAEYCAESGAVGLSKVIDGAVPLLRFAIDRRLAKWDLTMPEQRSRALRDVATLLAPVGESLLADDYANYIADALQADYDTVRRTIAMAEAHAPLTAVDEKAGEEPVEAKAPETPVQRLERELLSIAVASPALLRRLGNAFERVEWSSESNRIIAETLISAPENATSVDLVVLADGASPGAAALLTGGTIEFDSSESAEQAVRFLLRSLHELNLEQRIRSRNVRLRNPGAMSSEEFDALFAEVSSLQQELKEIRRT